MLTARHAWKVLVTHPDVPAVVHQLLEQHACKTIVCRSLPPSRAELLDKVRGVDGLFMTISGFGPLNAEVLDAAGPQLRAISTMSAGVDIVDLVEVRRRGIALGNTAIVLNDAVADLAVGLLLAASRRFHEGRLAVTSGTVENERIDWLAGRALCGSTVGFFGFGGIGQAIARRLAHFKLARLLYNTRRRLPAEAECQLNASHVSFEELLGESDFIVVIAPLTPETAGVFDRSAFAKMKPSAVFVNAARGGLVNQDDLYDALKAKVIFAAGLDVMTPEPLPADHRLLQLPNCVITPHLGASTEHTRLEMATLAAHNVLRGLAGEPMLAPVE